ncbi:MAG: D-alanine--D-alanine ligase [Kiritimatiellaeota bacterium]|nr:D-alanine--D-alanine ligase [Kiritimatiellota bacterium]
MALICLDAGVSVTGSDPADSWTVRRLRIRGAAIAARHEAANIGDADLVVFSSAVSPDNPELVAARRRRIRCVSRGEFLVAIAELYPCVVAVGGSHGKTTTTAMLAHILRRTGRRPGFLVGGEVRDRDAPARIGSGTIFVTEVDESDGSQALLNSSIAVVLNIDDDHSWALGGPRALEECFQEFAARGRELVVLRTPQTERLCRRHPAAHLVEAHAVRALPELPVPGTHNRLNAAIAVHVAVRLGVSADEAQAALGSFPGVLRRLTERFCTPDGTVTVIEDYAHHPTELAAALVAIRRTHPDKRLVVVFQPHRFERARRYAARFAACLEENADAAAVLPTFAAWKPGPGGDPAEALANEIRRIPARFMPVPSRNLLRQLTAWMSEKRTTGTAPERPRWVIAFIGAGDIRKHIPGVVDFLVTRCKSELAERLRGAGADLIVRLDRPWRDLTAYGVGSACPVVLEPRTRAARTRAEAIVRGAGFATHVLAAGAPTRLVGTDRETLVAVLFPRPATEQTIGATDTVPSAPMFEAVGDLPAEHFTARVDCAIIESGGCRLDPRHPNRILSRPDARESDFVTVLLTVRRRVYDSMGVRLMPACRFVNQESAQLVTSEPAAAHIAVLSGGPPECTERETSLTSGAAVAAGLREAGYRVTEIEVAAATLPPIPHGTDAVFPALHGYFGEDGGIQELLDERGVPYVGSGATASRLMMDKTASKAAVRAAGVPVPAAVRLSGPGAPLPAKLGFPLIVKPNGQGSSVAVTRLYSAEDGWQEAVSVAFAVSEDVIAEQYIEGTEITVGLLDGRPLPVIEIIPPGGRIFDKDAKYAHTHGHTQYLCPPRHVSPAVCERARELALTAWNVLKARDMLRVDFIVDADGTPWFLEANSIPGFTATSLLPMAAKHVGISFAELCGRLVRAHLSG